MAVALGVFGEEEVGVVRGVERREEVEKGELRREVSCERGTRGMGSHEGRRRRECWARAIGLSVARIDCIAAWCLSSSTSSEVEAELGGGKESFGANSPLVLLPRPPLLAVFPFRNQHSNIPPAILAYSSPRHPLSLNPPVGPFSRSSLSSA